MTTSYTAVGQAVPQEEGPDKVSGKAVYAADVQLPGMLWGHVLRSPYAHANIVRIETTRARQVPGVHVVLTGQDLPDRRVGRLLRDIPVLARDRVLFIGEKVAAVAAESTEAATEALNLIEVEYAPLSPVFDPLEAMQSTAPTLHPQMATYPGLPQPVATEQNVFAHNRWSKGDIAAGFDAADRIFEHTFSAQLMHQAYIEPHACVVHIDAAGRPQIWANNKGPFMLREQLAAVWDMPTERIRVHPTSIGGDFGGKGSFMDVPLCYYLALRSGRPVKMVMDYIQELMAANPRHPALITLKTGVTHDGRMLARQARIVFNSGAYGAFKPRVYIRGADHSGGPYRIPHVHIDSYMVYTNNVPCGHMRSPGKPQVAFAVESHMDMMAHELGLDPYEFRLRNMLQDGDVSPVGEALQHIRAEETLRQAAAAIGWGHKRRGPYTGRGLAIADQSQGAGQSSASVSIDASGQVQLFMALWDTGTGAHTIMRQIVAEMLTVPTQHVHLVMQDTDAIPYESGPGGTRVTYTAGQAVFGAARDLRDKLCAVAAELLEGPLESVQLVEGRFVMPGDPPRMLALTEVVARALSSTGNALRGSMSVTSTPPHMTSFCAQAAEVEVDPDTGQVTVTRVVSAHDVGTILNPLTHQGQIEGGMVQGFGYGLMEELRTEDGRISTLSLGEYKIPTIKDIPELVTVLLAPGPGPAPYQSKGIGESSNTPVAAAIANAVFDAVGVRILDLPVSAEKVFRALQARQRS
ncbi:MAG: xanthine dehydrogenase family protein molybdopterin-binding subunit [Candidatus Tectimicrobiota bacterium]